MHCADLWSSSGLCLAAARVQSAEEVRPRRAEGPAAHAQTLRTRAHGRPQESSADPASGTRQPLIIHNNSFKLIQNKSFVYIIYTILPKVLAPLLMTGLITLVISMSANLNV